ncbi:MAG TPA: long-chain fatty acid--CoA ligase [Candidatus Acidoferrales bacterium]|nr:long-chain fatty acid--CoA ligase [Candidatus Acidoferrales bacterium]
MATVATRRRPWVAHYDEGVPADVEIPDVPLDDLLRQAARRWPAAAALSLYGRRTTFAQLDQAVDRVARALRGLGVEPGDVVSLHLPTTPAFVQAFYGVVRAGAIGLPMNPLYVPREIAELFRLGRPRVSIALDLVTPRVRAARAEAGLDGPVVTVGIAEQLSRVKSLLYPLRARREGRWHPVAHAAATPHLARLVRDAAPGPFPSAAGPDDVAALQPTGGTTGTPKAAMLTHRNLVADTVQVAAWFSRARPGDAILGALPYFHIYGLTVAMNLGVLLGQRQVLLPRPETSEMLDAISRERPRMFPAVPAMYQAISVDPRASSLDLTSIDACISGGAPLPAEVQRRFEEVTGGRVVEGYGLSEASPVTHCNPLYGDRRAGTIGVPFPSTDAMVVSLADGHEVEPGEEGELLVRGPQVMKGYYQNPQETANALQDGWLRTGDMAVRDEDGYFRIVDRRKDVIIVGGINVWPREVEEVLLEHPLIADAAVVGVPHVRLGEVPRAFVVPAPGAQLTVEMVVAHCGANLAAHKVPRQVEFVDELPRSGVGKVLRRRLRAAE